MLRTSPFHKENFAADPRRSSGVLPEVLHEVPELYRGAEADRYRPESCLSERLGQRPDFHPWLFEIFKMPEVNTPKEDQLYRREAHLELNFVGKDDIVENKVIGSTRRNLAMLGSLYTNLTSGRRISSYAAVWTMSASLCWMIHALNALKVVPEIPLSPTTPLKLTPLSAVTPYTAGVPFLRPFDPSEPLQLPLLIDSRRRGGIRVRLFDHLRLYVSFPSSRFAFEGIDQLLERLSV